jgi:hypothetical protein
MVEGTAIMPVMIPARASLRICRKIPSFAGRDDNGIAEFMDADYI